MNVAAVVLSLCLLGAGEDSYYAYVKKVTNGVGDLFAAIVEGGGETWNKLSTPQAKDVLEDLASAAESLRKKNLDLEAAVRKSMLEHTEKDVQIGPRVEELRKLAKSFEDKLEKFRHEVDKASNAMKNHTRSETERAFEAKADLLEDVEKEWNKKNYDNALTILGDAERTLERGQNGIRCLRDSIDDKDTACDKNTLRPIEKKKTN